LHSTDIAFKPTDNGWGYSPKFSSNYDAIFGKKEPAVQATQGTASEPKGDEAYEAKDIFTSKGLELLRKEPDLVNEVLRRIRRE